jgi:CRISPR-associated protein (TIGR02710 family)
MADRRYDDAAARIYRALELFGQICFEEKTGISNNKVPEDMIPEAIRGEYIRKYKDPETEKLKLPLEATFKCLEALGDESGRRFVERHKEIKNIQRNRNLSILAHGINPVTEKAVKSIFEIVADFTGMKNSDYFDFPMLP